MMKATVKTPILPLFTLGAGGIGFALRLWLFATGVDEKGLLLAAHPANALSFILCAAVLVILFLYTRNPQKRTYSEAFPASKQAAVGNFIGAAGILFMGIKELTALLDPMTVICFVAAIVAAVCLVCMGICRLQGRKDTMVFPCAVTIYMVLHLICQYRSWSPEPQLQAYCFCLFASVFLMLALYHRTALSTGDGSLCWFGFANQAALFFCCLALQSENRLFYLTMGAWMALDTLASTQPQPEAMDDVSAQ